jgi:hypothetical protein
VSVENLKELLKVYIDFYTGQYFKSIIVNALSSTLLFLSGSQFYLYFKYGQIQGLRFDDFIVWGLGIILSFGISASANILQNNNQVKQLKSCLIEIEDETISQSSLKRYKRNKVKMITLFAIALIVGILVFLHLISK